MTKQDASTLRESLCDYSRIENLECVVGEGTDLKQQLKLSNDNLHLHFRAPEQVAVLDLLNIDILLKVNDNSGFL